MGDTTGLGEDSGSGDADPVTDTTGSSNTASTGEGSYCGDGVLDEGEECDDGLDNNGLDQACLPDCNLNVCGDSNVGPDEACDEGEDDNLLVPGACAPDCSRIIETREIVLSNYKLAQETGNFGPNPIATADAMCPNGYRALLAVPGERQVTNTPNQADAIVDWPLEPFTAYVNDDGEQLWVTDDMPLLGVRAGIPEPLEATVTAVGIFGGPWPATGLLQNWVANTAENCNNFSSASPALDMRLGNSSSTDLFLQETQALPCNDTPAQVFCVEQ